MAALARSLLITLVLAGTAACSSLSRPVPAASSADLAHTTPTRTEVTISGTPAATALRLAAECTRRRIAVTEKTPERVVCKHIAAGKSEIVNQPQAEIWTFVLDGSEAGRTKVEARRSYDAVQGIGYAIMTFAEPSSDNDATIRSFIDEVQALASLRGRVDP